MWMCTLVLLLSLLLSQGELFADYKKDIGFTALKADLDPLVPDGSGLALVTQTEAGTQQVEQSAKNLNDLARQLMGIVEQYRT